MLKVGDMVKTILTADEQDANFNNWSGPIGAYPHSGNFTMPNWDFQNILSCEDLLNIVREWVSMGVQVVGGCCGIGPEHIRTLKQALPLYAPSRT